MIIDYHKKFNKRYIKLTSAIQKKIDNVIEKFKDDPFHPPLKNHLLKGYLKGKRAISVTGDVRIIFEEHDGYAIVLMLDIGTHAQIYE